LYDWAGGEAALARMIDAFYDRVEADELLAPLFGGGVGVEHRDHVIACTRGWCASTSASASPRNSGTGSRR
jgi:truncated hemoglobin YjbI